MMILLAVIFEEQWVILQRGYLGTVGSGLKYGQHRGT